MMDNFRHPVPGHPVPVNAGRAALVVFMASFPLFLWYVLRPLF